MIAASKFRRYAGVVVVLAVMAVVAAVRWRLAGIPLERDEGEYAYVGQLILRGLPPYAFAYNMKFGLLVLNAATTFVVFLLGRTLLGGLAGAVGATTFALLSLDRWIMGVFAHATHFVLLPTLAGFLVLVRAIETRRARRLVIAGGLLGLAVLMKQAAIFFIPLAFGLLRWHERDQLRGRWRPVLVRSGLLATGMVIPLAIIVTAFVAQGVFGTFWFWTFQYATEYVVQVPLAEVGGRLADAWQDITQATRPIWVAGVVGLLGLWLGRWPSAVRMFLTGLLVASCLAVCAGFHFRQHYFILLLPVVALLVGVGVASIERVLRRVASSGTARALALLGFVGLVGSYAVQEQGYLLSMTAQDLIRSRYGTNPFLEAVDIARYLREHTTTDDRIAVLGSEPEIFFYANRRSASGHIYTYALMEPQRYAARMQDEMIREVEAVHPKYFVAVMVLTSWVPRPESDRRILTWIDEYTARCDDLVGVADSMTGAMAWDREAEGYSPRANHAVYTFRRKSEEPCQVGR